MARLHRPALAFCPQPRIPNGAPAPPPQAVDVAFLHYTIGKTLAHGVSAHLLFAFEFAVAASSIVVSAVKYALSAVDAALAQVRLAEKAELLAAALPHGDQRKLEVALLIALDPKVFMFDEPTAGMSVDEVPVILDLIRSLKASLRASGRGTILLVEHKMDVVRELADRIIVLHNGQLVADGEPAAVIASPVVQQAYLGMAAEEPA